MAEQELLAFRYGQHVRVTVCPHNHPDHVGQVGTVAQRYKKKTTIRVHIGTRICQAVAVELVTVSAPSPSVSKAASSAAPWPESGTSMAMARSLDVLFRRSQRL